jgi:hypothetical protein
MPELPKKQGVHRHQPAYKRKDASQILKCAVEKKEPLYSFIAHWYDASASRS